MARLQGARKAPTAVHPTQYDVIAEVHELRHDVHNQVFNKTGALREKFMKLGKRLAFCWRIRVRKQGDLGEMDSSSRHVSLPK
jgi:hypothetical protein